MLSSWELLVYYRFTPTWSNCKHRWEFRKVLTTILFFVLINVNDFFKQTWRNIGSWHEVVIYSGGLTNQMRHKNNVILFKKLSNMRIRRGRLNFQFNPKEVHKGVPQGEFFISKKHLPKAGTTISKRTLKGLIFILKEDALLFQS